MTIPLYVKMCAIVAILGAIAAILVSAESEHRTMVDKARKVVRTQPIAPGHMAESMSHYR